MSAVATVGRPHHHYGRTDSTNARAKALAQAGAPGGTVVTADEQTAGRGRQGRSWFAQPGTALLYSALLRTLGDRPLLPLAAPLAVCEACEALAPVRCEVKWPNDVWIEGRKVAGVLIEARPDEGWAVIGVGLNVAVPPEAFPPELRATAMSLGSNRLPTLADALDALNGCLARWLDAAEGEILESFRARDALRGRRLAWDGGEGIAAGIDDAGHLLVESGGDEPLRLGAGEVHLAVGDPASGRSG